MTAQPLSGRRVLAGKRILVTRAAHQAGKLSEGLRALGAEPVEVPVLEIQPPASFEPFDRALRSLGSYHWLILTSANTVRTLQERAQALALRLASTAALKVAAIGEATASAARKAGFSVSLVPETYVAESLVNELLHFGQNVSVHDRREVSGHDGREVSGHDRREVSGRDGREVSGQDGREVSGQDGREVSGHDGREVSGHDGREVSGHDGREVSGHDRREVSGHDRREVSGHDGREVSGHDSREESGRDGREVSVHDRREVSVHDRRSVSGHDLSRADSAAHKEGALAPEGSLRGLRFLLVRAEVARDVIPDALRAAGATVDVVDAYRNVMPEAAPDLLRAALEKGIDATTFTSSSSVTHLADAARAAGIAFPFAGVAAVSIGPITSQTLRDLGWEPAAEANPSHLAGLIAAVKFALREP